MYKVLRAKNRAVLYRVKKDGSLSEVCTVTDTSQGRLLVLKSYKLMGYKFAPVKFQQFGAECYAVVSGEVKVYKKPHSATFHKVVMLENRHRYNLANGRFKQGMATNEPLDYDGILENMLELVATI